MNRYGLCLLLLCLSSVASARDVRMHGANGDGGACPDATATPVIPAATTATKPPSTPYMPRWHSFLPGMFR